MLLQSLLKAESTPSLCSLESWAVGQCPLMKRQTALTGHRDDHRPGGHRYFLYLSPIIVQASPSSYNLLKALHEGRKLAVTGLATFIEQNTDAAGMQRAADKGISARYVILSIPLPDVIMSRRRTKAISLQNRRFISSDLI